MAVGILLRFQKERPAAIVRAVIQRMPGADVATPARPSRSRPADMFGARGSVMGFITPLTVAGLSTDGVHAGFRAPFGWAHNDSKDDAFGASAGTVPGNPFDL
jgi:hypothetical protein